MNIRRPEPPLRSHELHDRVGRRLSGRGYRRLHHGIWVRTDPDDEAPTRAGAPTWDNAHTRADALMTMYPGAVITGWHAALLHGHSFGPREFSDEISAPCRRITRPGIVAWQNRIPDSHCRNLRTRHGGVIRLASPEWALFDIARHSPRIEAICALDTAHTMGGDPIRRLPPLLASLRGVRGRRTVLELLDDVDPLSDSPWETRTRLFLLDNGLRGMVLQYRPPGFPYYLDLAWPEFLVAVEYDGADHRTREQQARDEIRRNRLRAAGWYIEVVTATSLSRRPEEILTHVRGALHHRGAQL